MEISQADGQVTVEQTRISTILPPCGRPVRIIDIAGVPGCAFRHKTAGIAGSSVPCADRQERWFACAVSCAPIPLVRDARPSTYCVGAPPGLTLTGAWEPRYRPSLSGLQPGGSGRQAISARTDALPASSRQDEALRLHVIIRVPQRRAQVGRLQGAG